MNTSLNLWCFSAAQQLCPIVSLSGRHITRERTANAGGQGYAGYDEDKGGRLNKNKYICQKGREEEGVTPAEPYGKAVIDAQ